MKLISCFLITQLALQPISTYTTEALDYLLRSIEFLVSVKPGLFSCVFIDFSPHFPYDNILNALLQSPRLEYVVKYVANGSYTEEMEKLPLHPSLLIIHPGQDLEHLKRNETKYNLYNYVVLFNPLTRMLVLGEPLDITSKMTFQSEMYEYRVKYSVFFDISTMRSRQINGYWQFDEIKPLDPIFLFESYRNYMAGLRIFYIKAENIVPFVWNYHWLNETARYLHTEAVEVPHNCSGSGPTFYKCLHKHQTSYSQVDIIFSLVYILLFLPRLFQTLYTSFPWIYTIVVPRDRPLNAVELMLLPFSWPVWTLLLTVIVLSEMAKRFFPRLFRNDPFLLAVCGFERHNLHRAGRWEKAVLLSLIILMFFMTNAFETRIVSLMVNKPSIQRIKTLADLTQSGLKFYADLENTPFNINHSVVGKMIVQGKAMELYEAAAGVARFEAHEKVQLLIDSTFDYDRMQSFYVALDYERYEAPETYLTSWRSLFLEPFRYIHLILTEAGLMDFWKRQWRDDLRSQYIGRRPRVDSESEVELNFEDMEPAWMALLIGFGVSVVGFLGEILLFRFDSRCSVRKSSIGKVIIVKAVSNRESEELSSSQ